MTASLEDLLDLVLQLFDQLFPFSRISMLSVCKTSSMRAATCFQQLPPGGSGQISSMRLCPCSFSTQPGNLFQSLAKFVVVDQHAIIQINIDLLCGDGVEDLIFVFLEF